MPWTVYPREESERSNSTVEFLYTFREGLIGFIVPSDALERPTTLGFSIVASCLVLASLIVLLSTLTT